MKVLFLQVGGKRLSWISEVTGSLTSAAAREIKKRKALASKEWCITGDTRSGCVEAGGRVVGRFYELDNLRVVLASVGNPDFGQDPDKPKWGAADDRIEVVDSLEHAAARCRAFIAENDLGSGNWAGGAVAQVEHPDVIIANVSYNGRVWPGADRLALVKPLLE